MYRLYYDSGTSHTRLFLLKDNRVMDTTFIKIGTKDSAISGSNDVLIAGLKEGMDRLLAVHGVKEDGVEGIYLSGMVTNPFGVKEVPHLTLPLDGERMLQGIHPHREEKAFHRVIHLIPGAKTGMPGEGLSLETVDQMGNARGEEIEVVGMVASGILPRQGNAIMVSPGSHTHLCLVEEGALVDISSHFTGELHHALLKETILGGETEKADIPLLPDMVVKGYELLQRHGITRALYVVHSTKVFDVADDAQRSMLLSGVITGSLMEHLKEKLAREWQDVRHMVVIGGKHYVEAYRILAGLLMPEVRVEIVIPEEKNGFALQGFQELMRIRGKLQEGADNKNRGGRT